MDGSGQFIQMAYVVYMAFSHEVHTKIRFVFSPTAEHPVELVACPSVVIRSDFDGFGIFMFSLRI